MKKNTKKRVKGAGRVGFLVKQDEFARMIEEGHPLRAIYNKHQDVLDISYSQFTRYVKRYIRTADHDTGRSDEHQKGQDAAADRARLTDNRNTGDAFTFDPTAGHRKEDYI